MPSLIENVFIGLAMSFICCVNVAVAIQQDTMNGIQEASIEFHAPVIDKQLEKANGIQDERKNLEISKTHDTLGHIHDGNNASTAESEQTGTIQGLFNLLKYWMTTPYNLNPQQGGDQVGLKDKTIAAASSIMHNFIIFMRTVIPYIYIYPLKG